MSRLPLICNVVEKIWNGGAIECACDETEDHTRIYWEGVRKVEATQEDEGTSESQEYISSRNWR